MKEKPARDFSHILNEVKGFSEKQLTSHIKLYEGYVKKMNEIEQKLKNADRSTANFSFAGEYGELMRRRSVPFNGVFLHETYFDNLVPGGEPDHDIKKMLTEEFGSMEKWEEDIKAAATTTTGWVLLTLDKTDHRVKHWILYEHQNFNPVFQDILLALDCWEHAFMIDYGIDKAAYLKAFLQNINWDIVNKRLNEIMKRK
jgi:Fe-Mn family superoxide dismutase